MDWEPYLRDRLLARHHSGFVVIKPADLLPPVPIACPVCLSLMRTSDDEEQYARFGCCDWCANRWAYPNAARWRAGWRPSSDDVARGAVDRIQPTVRFVID